MRTGTLFVVATPIGNRDDLAPRARRILGEADLVAAEDTRHTGRLLSHFGIETPLIAVHEHNEAELARELVGRLTAGANIALVSDAGTPLVSDPGYRLVVAAHEASVPVSPVPGPSAVVAALSVAGLPTDRFCFEGFLPAKAEARRRALVALADEPRSMVFLESVHRIGKLLPDLVRAFGPARRGFVGRELTKLHEQCVCGTLQDLADEVAAGNILARGEFVVVVAGADGEPRQDGIGPRRVLESLLPVLAGRQAVDIATELTGARRNDVYRLMLDMTSRETADGTPDDD
ncbi:MAG: 16S rRNA (cytidine(1402)-2'-O)-methyltransferase [Woeseiaceae bacterium]|nr:16S rRNA (cytidine(1402)-2'-O)-methyltransferase [Woeseiaceae bacterium]